jgi:large subunit ribosomal protein L9
MKVLLLEDVYKLGRAGDVKKVANGYGRNYLIPQGLAVLATPGALKQVEHIRVRAATQRAALNEEMSGVAEQLDDLVLTFSMKAGETDKLYGSVTTQMIADSLKENTGFEIDRRQIDAQPIRTIGEHKVNVRLTVDLVPEITVLVHREGEAVPETPEAEEAEDLETEVEVAEAVTEVEPEGEAEIEVEAVEEPVTEMEEAEETADEPLEEE